METPQERITKEIRKRFIEHYRTPTIPKHAVREWIDTLISHTISETLIEVVRVIEDISEFDARLAIEPSRDFLKGAVAMKSFAITVVEGLGKTGK